MKQEIYTKTAFGVGLGDGTYKSFAEIVPWLPAEERAWIRSIEVVIYGCKNAVGQTVPQSGWFGVGSSYNKAPTGNEYLFNWIGPNQTRTRTQFPSDCGIDFPRAANESPAPYFKLFGLMASGVEFTYFLTLTYTKEVI